jgi:hypothetical protein
MTKYGTVENNILTPAPRALMLNGAMVTNPKAEHFAALNEERAKQRFSSQPSTFFNRKETYMHNLKRLALIIIALPAAAFASVRIRDGSSEHLVFPADPEDHFSRSGFFPDALSQPGCLKPCKVPDRIL